MSNPPEQPPVYPPPGNPDAQPTAPLDPVPGRYPPPAYPPAETYVDPRPAAYHLEGLRTGLTIVGLLALIAIGLAVWALARPDHHRTVITRGPANSAAVAALNTRVNNLERTLHGLSASGGSKTAGTQALAAKLATLQQAQSQLAAQVKQSSTQAKHSSANPAQVSQLASKEAALSAKVSQLVGKEAALSGQVSGLQGRVSSLAGKVGQLQARSGQSTTTTTIPTTTTG